MSEERSYTDPKAIRRFLAEEVARRDRHEVEVVRQGGGTFRGVVIDYIPDGDPKHDPEDTDYLHLLTPGSSLGYAFRIPNIGCITVVGIAQERRR